MDPNADLVYLCRPEECSNIRQKLKSKGIIDPTKCIAKFDEEWLAVPLLQSAASQDLPTDRIKHFKLPRSGKRPVPPRAQLREKINSILKIPEDEIPKTWERHGNLVLFPESAFLTVDWKSAVGTKVLDIICEVLRVERVGKRGRVNSGGFRQPKVELIRGVDGWVKHNDNKVIYCYDVTKCMFSAGNITEKLWVASLNCTDEVIVDMFAGIGYFTLPYLVHTGAELVHACEWNADAVEAMRRSLSENGVSERCVIHFGDCRKVAPVGVADRVNLGLLPSSEIGWEAACLSLKVESGGWLHVHGNVNLLPPSVEKSGMERSWSSTKEWLEYVVDSFRSLCNKLGRDWRVEGRQVRKVKSYGPHILHAVADVECRRKN
eukprot:m.109586 g.109586  ORF g.109586 m.109586 type:complete len:377 (+) comp37354_c0_seq1:23-1153(+)